MSLTAKEGVHKLVKDALRSAWASGRISKDQYTDVNRNVCRLLYDRIGDEGNLNEGMNDTWHEMARAEVEKALAAL